MSESPDPSAALTTLADAIDPSNFTITSIAKPGRPPRLRIASKHAAQLAEDIYAGRGYFWWSWAERISPLTDPASAAAKIARVLHTRPPGTADPN